MGYWANLQMIEKAVTRWQFRGIKVHGFEANADT